MGQLVTNLSYLALGPSQDAAWEIEDEEMLKAGQQHLADLMRKQQVGTSPSDYIRSSQNSLTRFSIAGSTGRRSMLLAP
jgi:hypothetical protein